MAKYVILLRGVNVGGASLSMEDFRSALAYIGFKNARTYIQSGNAVAESPDTTIRKMESEIEYELASRMGRKVAAFVVPADEFARAAAAHPLAGEDRPDREEDKLYVTVLSQSPSRGDEDNLMDTMNGVDEHLVRGRFVYSYYGEGYGKSRRDNTFIEKMLKVTATTRNWNTMRRLLAMSAGDENPA